MCKGHMNIAIQRLNIPSPASNCSLIYLAAHPVRQTRRSNLPNDRLTCCPDFGLRVPLQEEFKDRAERRVDFIHDEVHRSASFSDSGVWSCSSLRRLGQRGLQGILVTIFALVYLSQCGVDILQEGLLVQMGQPHVHECGLCEQKA